MNIYRPFFIITPKQKHNVLPQRTDEQRVHYAEIKTNKPQAHAVDMGEFEKHAKWARSDTEGFSSCDPITGPSIKGMEDTACQWRQEAGLAAEEHRGFGGSCINKSCTSRSWWGLHSCKHLAKLIKWCIQWEWISFYVNFILIIELRAGGGGGSREWDGWMASSTQWTWVWANSGSQWGFPGGSVVKNPPVNAGDREMRAPSLGQEDHLEEEVATHFSILAWKILWTEEPGRLQSMWLQSQTRLSDWADSV